MRDKALGQTWAVYFGTAREAVGYSKAELARAAGVGRATVYRWEAGEQRPEQAEVVARVVEVLGLDLDEALTAAGLRPDAKPPAVPTRQERPLDADLKILNDRLMNPAVSASEKHLIRAQLRYLVELAERPGQRAES